MKRRGLLALAASLAAFAGMAQAQPYPSKLITIVSPFPAGSTTDVIARIVGDRLRETLGQPVIVDNRPGAAGTIGSAFVARAPADGYTLLIASQSHTAVATLYSSVTWDPVKSFAPVVLVGVIPNVIAVHKSVPFKTLQELVAYAKTKPGQLNYASGGGVGTSPQLTAEMLNYMAGIKLTYIPYKSSPEAFNALLAGDVTMAPLGLVIAKPPIQSGELRALAVTTPKRSPALPDVPTVAESGYPDYDVRPWYAFLAPAGTPDAIVAKLNAAISEALKSPEVASKLVNLGLELDPGTPEELTKYLQVDAARWANLIKQTGMRVE